AVSSDQIVCSRQRCAPAACICDAGRFSRIAQVGTVYISTRIFYRVRIDGIPQLSWRYAEAKPGTCKLGFRGRTEARRKSQIE
ncbi:MAG TPA: hypothetical protein VGV87_01650, partial [Blastocatellia bacterium]|nr:hypothetical protein [Blastocatellia bacterium]